MPPIEDCDFDQLVQYRIHQQLQPAHHRRGCLIRETAPMAWRSSATHKPSAIRYSIT